MCSLSVLISIYSFQVEEFGREMYKLFKTFNSKAKQLAKEKGKGGGARDDSEDVYAPIKITTTIQDQVKQFKVHCIIYTH